jgi:hypothetical protein
MATRKPSTAVATRRPAALAQPLDWKARLLKSVETANEQLARISESTAPTLSFRGGTITYQNNNLGNEIEIIPLAPQHERVYYAEEFDASNRQPPACYSYDGQAPHPNASDPQAKTCSGCPHDEWGSDARRGKGKACKEGLRLAMITSDATTPEQIAAAKIVMAKFSVMNAKAIKVSLTALGKKVGHSSKAICRLTCKPDPTRQIANTLEFIEEVDDDLMPAIVERLDEAERLVSLPYPDRTADERAAPAKRSSAAPKVATTKRRF